LSRRDLLEKKDLVKPQSPDVGIKRLGDIMVQVPVVAMDERDSRVAVSWIRRCLPDDPAYSAVDFKPVSSIGKTTGEIVGKAKVVVNVGGNIRLKEDIGKMPEPRPKVIDIYTRGVGHGSAQKSPIESIEDVARELARIGVKPAEGEPRARESYLVPVFCGDGLNRSPLKAKEMGRDANRVKDVGLIFKPMGIRAFLDNDDLDFEHGGKERLRNATKGALAIVQTANLHSRRGKTLAELLEQAYEGHGKPPEVLFVPVHLPPHGYLTAEQGVDKLVEMAKKRRRE